jgi:uncharacterized RmlC-like cupin family protein
MSGIRVARAEGRPVTEQTSGMLLEEAFAGNGVWVGQLRTPPGSIGGWHHHGDHDTYTYLAEGRARFEWGAGGCERLDLMAGQFVNVPARVVHRESNHGTSPNLLIVFRKGAGPTLVGAEAP